MRQVRYFVSDWKKCKAILSGLLAVMLFTGYAPALSRVSAAAEPGTQVMPLMINGSYVLFPGKLAPFQKEGRLLVPLRAFADAIGAQLVYDTPTQSISVSLLGRAVSGIKKGNRSAVVNGNPEFSLGVEPELRDGTLFVPMSHILEGLYSIRFENRNNALYKISTVIQARKGAVLPRTAPSLLISPYADSAAVYPNPLYPTVLSQVRSGKEQRLTVKVLNASGFILNKQSTVLELVAVDSKGEATLRSLRGPGAQTAKGSALSFTFTVPSAAEYVIFDSRIMNWK